MKICWLMKAMIKANYMGLALIGWLTMIEAKYMGKL